MYCICIFNIQMHILRDFDNKCIFPRFLRISAYFGNSK